MGNEAGGMKNQEINRGRMKEDESASSFGMLHSAFISQNCLTVK
jgi:hypothetical protein